MPEFEAKTTSSFDVDYKKIRKNYELITRLKGKIVEILENPYHYKPLRNILKNKRRTHIGSFVLIFEIIEEEKVVIFHALKRHDEAY